MVNPLILVLLPTAFAAGVHRLKLHKVTPTLKNTSLEAEYLAHKYGAHVRRDGHDVPLYNFMNAQYYTVDLVFPQQSLAKMSFVSNVDHLTLGNGVYNNVHGNLNITHNFYGRKRVHCDEIDIGDAPSLLEPANKRRRRDSGNWVKVIRVEHLKLALQIGAGPGYLLHMGEVKGRAVVVKVFNSGPTVRERLESTVARSEGLLHPNVMRIEGVSSAQSMTHFIAYEDARKTAEFPLAAALREDLTKNGNGVAANLLDCRTLCEYVLNRPLLEYLPFLGMLFKSAMNYLMSAYSTSPWSLGVENFDVLLDANDRFLISINSSPWSMENSASRDRDLQDNSTSARTVFDALCQRVLTAMAFTLYI
ncbi:hypothetical protein DFH06DRAFT_1349511 [Mycena polygramma]|nr:hypothetical protein DFH06DRAFT_1349511 [Mycena polygramma]